MNVEKRSHRVPMGNKSTPSINVPDTCKNFHSLRVNLIFCTCEVSTKLAKLFPIGTMCEYLFLVLLVHVKSFDVPRPRGFWHMFRFLARKMAGNSINKKMANEHYGTL